MRDGPMKYLRHAKSLGLIAAALLYCGRLASGADDNSLASKTARDYRFDKTISREVLENYLSRSITMEGIFNGRGDFDDNLRMIQCIGAKYIGRSLCLWNGEANFLRNIERAKQQVPKALAVDPDLILEACVFETVSPGVEQVPIPDWVFTALGQPVVQRNFVYADMVYAAARLNAGRSGETPRCRMKAALKRRCGFTIRRPRISIAASKAFTSARSKS